MNVCIRVLRWIVIDDSLNLADVETTRRDVCCNQKSLFEFERVYYGGSLELGFVAVQGQRGNTHLVLEMFDETLALVDMIDEDQDLTSL